MIGRRALLLGGTTLLAGCTLGSGTSWLPWIPPSPLPVEAAPRLPGQLATAAALAQHLIENAKPWKPDTAGAIARNEILRTSKRVGRTIWRRWSGYHRRSRAETKMHCVKLLGQRIMARDFDRQVAEFQVRVAVLNGFTALGTPVTEAKG